MGDRRVIALTHDGSEGVEGGLPLRVVWLDAHEAAAEMVRRHHLSGRAARLGPELLVANLLLAVWAKGDERVSLQLQGELPRVAFHGQAWADGRIRARMVPGRLTSGEALVEGMMLAIKDDGAREMYRGVTPVQGEHVADALQRHLSTSDQLAARVRIEVEDGVARGLLVEALPASAHEAALTTERTLPGWADGPLDAIPAALEQGALDGVGWDLVEEIDVAFRCVCSRDRVETMLLGLGEDELADMLASDGQAEVTCEFCREPYRFDGDALRELLAMARAPEA